MLNENKYNKYNILTGTINRPPRFSLNLRKFRILAQISWDNKLKIIIKVNLKTRRLKSCCLFKSTQKKTILNEISTKIGNFKFKKQWLIFILLKF